MDATKSAPSCRRAPFFFLESALPACTIRRSTLEVIVRPVLLAPLPLHGKRGGRECPDAPTPRATYAAGRDFPKPQHAAPTRNIFSFPPCTAHFLFDVSKRKWGVHSRWQSRRRPRTASARSTGWPIRQETSRHQRRRTDTALERPPHRPPERVPFRRRRRPA